MAFYYLLNQLYHISIIMVITYTKKYMLALDCIMNLRKVLD